ncbi:MAG: hypothetical protein MR388_03870 [Tenericutes bacterium]|nr:hypothetical protein [Mycoplasmatota bacterium]
MNLRHNLEDFNDFFLNNEEYNDEILFELDSLHCKLDILAKMLLLDNFEEKLKLYKQFFQ